MLTDAVQQEINATQFPSAHSDRNDRTVVIPVPPVDADEPVIHSVAINSGQSTTWEHVSAGV